MNAKCLCCTTRNAESSEYSAFQLCTGCARELSPGPDVAKYQLLHELAGYEINTEN